MAKNCLPSKVIILNENFALNYTNEAVYSLEEDIFLIVRFPTVGLQTPLIPPM
jgi:hypothetical protein